MFITGILVSIWMLLFNRYYTVLFSILFIFVFLMEIYIDFVTISTYLPSIWLHINNNQPIHNSLKFLWSYVMNNSLLIRQNRSLISREYSIQIQNRFRRSMFLRIHNLFQKTISDPSSHSHYSLFDYRCPVCLNNRQDSFRWIALGCGHILCSLCIQHLYFGNKPICPNCRSPIILSHLTILYI